MLCPLWLVPWSISESFLFSSRLCETFAMVPFCPQQTRKGIICSMADRHWTHFFMMGAQWSQATMWPQGLKKIEALRSEQTMHSSIWGKFEIDFKFSRKIYIWLTFSLDETVSRQIKHFLIREPHASHAITWPHGLKTVSRFCSEQRRHSSVICASEASSFVCCVCCRFSLFTTLLLMFFSSIVVVSMSSVCFSL